MIDDIEGARVIRDCSLTPRDDDVGLGGLDVGGEMTSGFDLAKFETFDLTTKELDGNAEAEGESRAGEVTDIGGVLGNGARIAVSEGVMESWENEDMLPWRVRLNVEVDDEVSIMVVLRARASGVDGSESVEFAFAVSTLTRTRATGRIGEDLPSRPLWSLEGEAGLGIEVGFDFTVLYSTVCVEMLLGGLRTWALLVTLALGLIDGEGDRSLGTGRDLIGDGGRLLSRTLWGSSNTLVTTYTAILSSW